MSLSSAVASRIEAPGYDARLPLQWQPLDAVPEPRVLEQLADDNLRVLSAVATLDEQRGLAPAGDETGPLDGEIARLHQKLNLLVDLVALLVSQQTPAPTPQALRLSWEGLRWTDPQAEGLGVVRLRLHLGVPQAFAWPARIVSRSGDEVEARFEPMPEGCQMALEKHVFLHHRRAIAGTRRPGAA